MPARSAATSRSIWLRTLVSSASVSAASLGPAAVACPLSSSSPMANSACTTSSVTPVSSAGVLRSFLLSIGNSLLPMASSFMAVPSAIGRS